MTPDSGPRESLVELTISKVFSVDELKIVHLGRVLRKKLVNDLLLLIQRNVIIEVEGPDNRKQLFGLV